MAKTDQMFILEQNEGFAEIDETAEYLHPESRLIEPGEALTETQYLPFNIPEANIHGMGYLWHHPNLGSIAGGIWAWQGIKQHMLECEILDWRSFMSDAPLKDDLHEYRLSNGYGARIIEPLKKLHMSYSDESRGNEVDIELTAVTPPVMFGSGMHFEQGMKTSGHVTIRGKRYEVDGFSVRDRSWGQLRPEDHMSLPPMTWMTCVFNEDFVFNCSAFDHPDLDPDWKGKFDLPADQALKGGWVYKDGELAEIKSARKRTTHDPVSLRPTRIDLDITDSAGREFSIRGEIIASSPMAVWPNVSAFISLTRWECDGLVGHGDSQDIQWADYVQAMKE